MNRMKLLSACLATATGAFGAAGQSLNVDIDRASGSGTGAPASSYGAAAGQAKPIASPVSPSSSAIPRPTGQLRIRRLPATGRKA